MATVAALILLAQAAPPGSNLPATALGVAGVFIAFLQWAVWTLWKDGRAKDQQYLALVERVLPALAKSADAHSQAAEALHGQAAAVTALAERMPTVEEIAQIRRELRRRPG